MSRILDGFGDDFIELAAGGVAAVTGGPMSVAIITKPAGGFCGLIHAEKAAAIQWEIWGESGTYFTLPGGFAAGPPVVNDTWQLIGYSITAPGATPRYHYVPHEGVDAGVWVHQDGTSTNPGGSGPLDLLSIGRGTRRGNGLVAAGVVYGVYLDDSDWETQLGYLSAQSWFDLGPAGMWRLNQATATDPVVDDTGGGADQTASTDPAVSADEPPGWDYTLTTGTDATVNAAVVGGAVAVPAVAVRTGATVTASVVAGHATVPAVTSTATISPAVVAATATIPAPAVRVGETVVATAIAAAATIPAVTVHTGQTASISVVAGAATVPGVAVTSDTAVTVAAVAVAATIPSPTTTMVVHTVAGAVTIPAVAVRTGSTVSVGVVAGTVLVGSVGVQAGADVSIPVTVLTASATVGAVTVIAATVIAPAVVLAVAGIPAPAVAAGGGALVAVTVILVRASIGGVAVVAAGLPLMGGTVAVLDWSSAAVPLSLGGSARLA